MKAIACAVFGAVVMCLSAWQPSRSAEATPIAAPDYALHRVTDKIYVIYGPFDIPNNKNRGFRNNPVIVLTSQGVVVFDPGGSAHAGERVVEKIKTISKDPIVAIFNSHAHGDHWLGNEGVKRTYPQAVIYGHPGMKALVDGAEGDRWLAMIERLTGEPPGVRRSSDRTRR